MRISLWDFKDNVLSTLYEGVESSVTTKSVSIDESETGATETIEASRQREMFGAIAYHPVVGNWFIHRLNRELRNPGKWFTAEQVADITSSGAIDWQKLIQAIIAALPQILAFIQAIMKLFGL